MPVSATENTFLTSDIINETSVETASINEQTGLTYTLALSDRGQVVAMNNASANTVTVPTNSAVAFDVGSVVVIYQTGAGLTTVTGDTGVTINGVSAGSGDITDQYKAVSLLKIATDSWIITGEVGAIA